MENEWNTYYKKNTSVQEYYGDIIAHIPLFEEIIKENQNNGNILETGIGTGSMSIFLSHLGYNVVGIDNNEQILQEAIRLNKSVVGIDRKIFINDKLIENIKEGKITFSQCDAFQLSNKFADHEFDIVFSQGFFEHFNNEEIVTLIKEQLKVGKCVIFSVPSNFYPVEGLFGNERLLSISEWGEILKDFNIVFIKDYKSQIHILIKVTR